MKTGNSCIEIIKIIKTEFPELRICQIIGNNFLAGDNYYKEDKELLERLNEQLNALRSEKNAI